MIALNRLLNRIYVVWVGGLGVNRYVDLGESNAFVMRRDYTSVWDDNGSFDSLTSDESNVIST